jgi:TrmH family RNA methyltransferase
VLSKNKIKLIQSLRTKKYRQKYNKFTVEGHKSSVEFLNSLIYPIEMVIALPEWVEENSRMVAQKNYPVHIVPASIMKVLTQFKTPSPIMLVCQMKEEDLNFLEKAHSLIFLDNVQDPGNVGTIIRIADWFGLDGVLLSTGSVDLFNPKLIAASMGSFINVNMCTNAETLITNDLLEFEFVAADMVGVDYKKFTFSKKTVLCFGNEGHGFSKAVESRINHWINIPGAPQRVAESLNVAIATSIICANWKL